MFFKKLRNYFTAVIFTILLSLNLKALDNSGPEFILAFLPNYTGTSTVQLHLTSDVVTNVTVEYPVNSPTFTQTVAVSPGAVTIVNLPNSAQSNWLDLKNIAGANNSVRAYSTDGRNFVCYMINIQPFTSDAALGLPVIALNTDYIIASYRPIFSDGSSFVITAVYDNTNITITPSVNLNGGRTAGVPFNITLNRGQGYFNTGTTNSQAGDVTGTIITSDKPIQVTNGERCTNIPPGYYACDHIFEVAHPIQSWGLSTPVANLPFRSSGTVYRILASQDNTTIRRNGTVIANINRGQYFEPAPLTGNHLFEADKPIFVVQYMSGQDFGGSGTGDPAMGNMIPSDQYKLGYTFSTVGGSQFSQNFVSVYAQNSDIGTSMSINGVLVPPASFTPIPGTTLSAATVPLTSGSHTTRSANKHGITVEGYNNYDSYLYPGGASFTFINIFGDTIPPQCSATRVGDEFQGVARDTYDIDKGIYFVQLAPGSVNLQLTVTPFTIGDKTVTFTVTRIDPNLDASGEVVVTDGAGNTCSSPIVFTNALPPTVVTLGVNSLGGTFADVGGDVTDDGGDPVTERGIAWSITNSNPTIADNVITSGSGVGSFNAMISSLPPGTTVYYRAYAINNGGTGYGDVLTFTTPSAGNIVISLSTKVVCEDQPVDLGSPDAITGGSGSYQIRWIPNVGLLNANTMNPTLTKAKFSGYYILEVTDYVTGEYAQSVMLLMVKEKPDVSFPTTKYTITRGQFVNIGDGMAIRNGKEPYTFRWTDKMGFNSTLQNPRVNPSVTTRYFLIVTDADGCPSSEYTIIVQVLRRKAADEDKLVKFNFGDVAVYPNPVNGQFTINADFGVETDFELKLTNLLGQEFLRYSEARMSVVEQTFNVETLPAGVYMLHFKANDETKVFKLIKN
ncbi:MAG: T9SS type A sorting domain-containing protein [Candidatus Kapabacteria bacterium]|nr:T9SS type A sorting domain-containing protein [Candidatus Kapabacteria bacterium]